MRFRKTRKGLRADVSQVEAAVLHQCATELLGLLGEPDQGQDPLAALVGMPAGDVRPPEDPALGRLLPDAYREDPAAATEFRRYTDADLRAGKRASAQAVLDTLPPGGGQLLLDRDQADAWLGCLNDLRLVLGTRLGVTEETDAYDVDPDDPDGHLLQVYGWLAWLQESLLSCLSPRSAS